MDSNSDSKKRNNHPNSRGNSRGRGGRGGNSSRGRGSTTRGRGSNKPTSNRNQQSSSTSSGEPGVNKIKSSLRQVRRLLSKPDLPPDTKDEAERRLKVLEQDLEIKEKENLEKENSLKFRKIRFFERKRCERRIGTLKLKLQQELEKKGKGKGKDAEKGKDYNGMLKEAREMLNYVLVSLLVRKRSKKALEWENGDLL